MSQYDGSFKRWGSISTFHGCYVRYCLHYGFKINMLLKYNLLLVTTYIKCQLNIIVVLNDMTLYHAFLANKNILLLLKYYNVVDIITSQK